MHILAHLAILFHRRPDRRKCIQNVIPFLALNRLFPVYYFHFLVSDNAISLYFSHVSSSANAAQSGVLIASLKTEQEHHQVRF